MKKDLQNVVNRLDGNENSYEISEVESSISTLDEIIPGNGVFAKFLNQELSNPFEMIRKANMDLREWGEQQEADLIEANKEIDILTAEKDQLEFQLRNLQSGKWEANFRSDISEDNVERVITVINPYNK